MSDKILRVHVERDGAVQKSLVLKDAKVKVGTLPTCQLGLDHPSVTSIHAAIEAQGDGTYLVIDLGSARGTYINGNKISKGNARHGDRLKFGEVEVQLEVTTRAALEAERLAAEAAAAAAAIPEGHIVLEDGSTVEPFAMEGYYDDDGNYIPGYYDEDGNYHYGYGFHDDNGEWKVAHGFYDPEGEWVPTIGPEGERPSDKEVYTENFFQGGSGNVLEVAFLWTDYVLDVQAHHKPRSITIGGAEGNDYVLEDAVLAVPSFPMVSHSEEAGYQLNFMPQMTGLIQRNGEQFSLAEAASQGGARASNVAPGAQSVVLRPGMSARLEFGPNTFLIRFTTPPVLAGALYGVEKAPLFYQGVSLALHLAFMLLVFTLPEGFGRLELHDFRADDRFVDLLTPPEQEEEEEMDWLDDAPEETAAHAGDEGEAGDEEAEEVDLQMAIEGDVDPEDVELQRQVDEQIALDAGALAVFSEIGSAFTDFDQTIGSDAMMALGNLEGAAQGEARGVGGLGLASAGRGGGGTSDRGLGRALIGGGGGLGGGGTGGTGVDIGDREVREPQLSLAPPEVEGYLDREIIQRIVRQHRREMIHCYETELQRNPQLAGRVVMTWVIAGNGSVVSASVSETTLNNSTVESCMAQRIRRWVFPEPTGGGIVRVNYPFNFSS
jgi:hypothetical protein